MTGQEFAKRMRALFPQADGSPVAAWAGWLERQGIPYETVCDAFYGIRQQYGGELANLMFIAGPRRYCLCPNEFMLAAEYLYQGGAIERIDERPSHAERQDRSVCQTMEMRQGGR